MAVLSFVVTSIFITLTTASTIEVQPGNEAIQLVPNTRNGIAKTTFELSTCDGCKMKATCLFSTDSCIMASIQIHNGESLKEYCPENTPFLMMNSIKNYMNVTFRNYGKRIESFCKVVATIPYLNVQEPLIDSREHGILNKGSKNTSCKCGWTNKTPGRIVGGENATPNEYSFSALLVYRDTLSPYCGGSIITQYHILTASHCTQPFKHRQLGAIIGDHDLLLRDETPYAVLHDVKRTIEYPKYHQVTSEGDIALVELETRIDFNNVIGPVCLPSAQEDIVGEYVKVMGWGLTKDPTENGRISTILKKVNLRVVNPDVCHTLYNINKSPRTQICTYNSKKDSCRGDSGGPLVKLNPLTNAYEQVGVVSYGRKCGSTDPAINTDVAYFVDWIKTEIAKFGRNMRICQ